jgi:hypothetical protein
MPVIDSPLARARRIAVDDTSAVGALIKKINGEDVAVNSRRIREASDGRRTGSSPTETPDREITAKCDNSSSAG